MAEVFFFIAGIGAVAGAIGVVSVRNPFYAVLSLVFHLLSLAAMFLVYAGAVMVLSVFVVAYVGAAEPVRLRSPVSAGQRALALIFALALFVELAVAVLGSALKGIGTEGAAYRPGFGTPEQIGELLLTKFLLPFEVASFLLLIAAVGAVVLARRRGGIHGEDEGTLSVRDFSRPLGTGTMAEGVGGLPRAHNEGTESLGEAEPRQPAGHGSGGW